MLFCIQIDRGGSDSDGRLGGYYFLNRSDYCVIIGAGRNTNIITRHLDMLAIQRSKFCVKRVRDATNGCRGTCNIGDVVMRSTNRKCAFVLNIIGQLGRRGGSNPGIHVCTCEDSRIFCLIVGFSCSSDGGRIVELIYTAIDNDATRKFHHVTDIIVGLCVVLIVVIHITCSVANDEASLTFGHDSALHSIRACSGDVRNVINYVRIASLRHCNVLGDSSAIVCVSKSNGCRACCGSLVDCAGEGNGFTDFTKGKPIRFGSCSQHTAIHWVINKVFNFITINIVSDFDIVGSDRRWCDTTTFRPCDLNLIKIQSSTCGTNANKCILVCDFKLSSSLGNGTNQSARSVAIQIRSSIVS